MDPGHTTVRNALRIIGPIIALIGLGFIVVGMVGFFRAFGSFGPPKHAWCPFVGMPLLFVGIVLSSYGYMGKVMRYGAQETAPVIKDTFNYMADGTQEGTDGGGAIGQGLKEGGLGPGGRARRSAATSVTHHDAAPDLRPVGHDGESQTLSAAGK